MVSCHGTFSLSGSSLKFYKGFSLMQLLFSLIIILVQIWEYLAKTALLFDSINCLMVQLAIDDKKNPFCWN